MGQGEMSLPPLEVLERLAQACDMIEREVREGRVVDIDALVAEFPEDYRAFVRPELQGVLDELIPTSVPPEERDFEGGTSAESDGRYRWMEELGEGGMGRVSVAWDRELSRRVAIKVLNPLKAHDPRYRHRFEQEAEITARLDHPGILPIYGRGKQADQTPYYAMRLVAGGDAKTLQAAINALHALPRGSGQHTTEMRQLLRRLIDVSNTVAYAHSRGVCHRDLKPANILIGPFGETLVVDWGLARAFGEGVGGGRAAGMEADNGADSPVMGHNQSDGAGTPGFVAPEAREGSGAIDWPRVDVYSLGAILHCVLVGSAPMAEITEGVTQDEENSLTSTGQTLSSRKEPTMKARDTEKRSALRLGPGIPKALATICEVALRPDPRSRYPGPLPFADDLERYLSGEPVSVLPETRLDAIGRWVAANRKLVIASAAFVGLMLAALGWIVAQQWRHNVALRDQSTRLAVEHNRIRLAWALHNLGLHHRNRGDQEAAVDALERAAAIRVKLVRDYPSVLRYRTDLANSMVALGTALWNVGRHEESIAKSEEGIRRHRELMKQMPQSPAAAMEMALRLHTLGHHYMQSFLFAQGEEAFAESLRLVDDLIAGNPANPSMVALHRELTYREAQRLLGRGKWDEAKGKIAAIWGMLQNGPEVAPQSVPPIDHDALLDAWSLAAERCGDKSAVENIGRLREAEMAKEGETKGELREIDAMLANGLDADAIAATDSDRLAVTAKRAYRKGEYGRVQRICEELLARWDSDGDLLPPGGITRWEVLVRYAESAIRDSERYEASGDIDEGTGRREIALTAMREVPSALRGADGKGPSRQDSIEAMERTLRNAVFVPVRAESGLTRLAEDERSGWTELWEAIEKAIKGNEK